MINSVSNILFQKEHKKNKGQVFPPDLTKQPDACPLNLA